MEGGGGIGLFRCGFFFVSVSFRLMFSALSFFFPVSNLFRCFSFWTILVACSVFFVCLLFIFFFLLFFLLFFCVFWKTGSPEAHEGKTLEGRHTGERRVLLSIYQASFLVGVFFWVEFSRSRYVGVQVNVASFMLKLMSAL